MCHAHVSPPHTQGREAVAVRGPSWPGNEVWGKEAPPEHLGPETPRRKAASSLTVMCLLQPGAWCL